jgi:hypothetical protein
LGSPTTKDQRVQSTMRIRSWDDAPRELHGNKRAYAGHSPSGRNGFLLAQALVSSALLTRLRQARHIGSGGKDVGVSDDAALVFDLGDEACR